jgi:hypothetical protein
MSLYIIAICNPPAGIVARKLHQLMVEPLLNIGEKAGHKS